MKVFISWSGPRSQLLAEALKVWIHDVIQSVECFCSTDDIRAGQRWNNEVNTGSPTQTSEFCASRGEHEGAVAQLRIGRARETNQR